MTVMTRPPRPPSEYELAEPDDANICKPRTWLSRVQAMKTVLQQIEKHTSSDLSNIIDCVIPEKISYTAVSVGESVVIAKLQERKRGRPRDDANDENVEWTCDRAVRVVKEITVSLNTQGKFPTSVEFTQAGQGYLLKLIKKNRFKHKITQFANVCNLSYVSARKRRKTSHRL